MRFVFINEKELEKFNSIFTTMNVISNSMSKEYIKSKMERYSFIARIHGYSTETIRKIFRKTRTYKWVRKGNYKFQYFYYDLEIFLTNLNNKRKWSNENRYRKNYSKHYQVGKLIRSIAKATKNKVSAKTLSKIILIKLNVYYSAKHLYWLIRNNLIHGVSLRIFPYLKYGRYHKRNSKETKRFIATPISERDSEINLRTRCGDVEVDTVEGLKHDNYYLSTMIDRKSKRLSITLYQSKSASSFIEAVKRNMKKMLDLVLSITSDNGTENAKLNELNIPWFATNSYSSWQKGTIEQKHKQIRKFIPKGKSFARITQEYCDLIALVINAETYLQNSSKYKLGKIITHEELEKYFELINQKNPHPIFCLW